MSDFDRVADRYADLVQDAMMLHGSDHAYFNQYKLFYLKPLIENKQRALGRPVKFLDYGCGIGLMAKVLQTAFPSMILHGFDVSAQSIADIDVGLKCGGNRFTDCLQDLDNDYDIAFLCTVLHHVDIEEREQVLRNIYARLSNQGELIIIEHNMRNPLTKRSVNNCIFDEDAVMLAPHTCRALLKRAGYHEIQNRYITFFPRQLSKLWVLDRYMAWLPFGAQYMMTGRKLFM